MAAWLLSLLLMDAMYEPGSRVAGPRSTVPARIGIAYYDPADPDLAPARGQWPTRHNP